MKNVNRKRLTDEFRNKYRQKVLENTSSHIQRKTETDKGAIAHREKDRDR